MNLTESERRHKEFGRIPNNPKRIKCMQENESIEENQERSSEKIQQSLKEYAKSARESENIRDPKEFKRIRKESEKI